MREHPVDFVVADATVVPPLRYVCNRRNPRRTRTLPVATEVLGERRVGWDVWWAGRRPWYG